jgi:hypothetical protein
MMIVQGDAFMTSTELSWHLNTLNCRDQQQLGDRINVVRTGIAEARKKGMSWAWYLPWLVATNAMYK